MFNAQMKYTCYIPGNGLVMLAILKKPSFDSSPKNGTWQGMCTVNIERSLREQSQTRHVRNVISHLQGSITIGCILRNARSSLESK